MSSTPKNALVEEYYAWLHNPKKTASDWGPALALEITRLTNECARHEAENAHLHSIVRALNGEGW